MTSTFPMRIALALLAAVLSLPATGVFAPSTAAAQQSQTLNATVQVIVASSNGTGVDTALAPIGANLARQFSLFDSFALDANHRLILQVGVTRSIALPGGAEAHFTLERLVGSDATIRIEIPGGSSTITTQGGLVFVGGSRAPAGRIILAITT